MLRGGVQWLQVQTGATRCCYDGCHRLHHITHVAVAHARVDRQRNLSLVLSEGHREVARLLAVGCAVVWVQVQRDEVDAGADLLLAQRLDKRCAIDREAIEV